MRAMAKHLIEVLTFAGCPHRTSALELAERVVREMAADAEVREVEVADEGGAIAQRFLGSPTIRVDGRDVEPGAEQRSDFALSCRVYRTARGLVGQPEEHWLRDALLDLAAVGERERRRLAG
jgi:hypothetical protein